MISSVALPAHGHGFTVAMPFDVRQAAIQIKAERIVVERLAQRADVLGQLPLEHFGGDRPPPRCRRSVAGAAKRPKGGAMPQKVTEVMTHDPRTVEPSTTLTGAAQIMRDEDVGAVVVVENGAAAGLVTDRDIVVRAIADGRDPNSTSVGEIASHDLRTLSPDQNVEDASRLMREWDVRRVVVVQDGRPVGIVSLGDLAIERDSDSVLADIASEPPNR
jgi:CBS domain-containing protein